MAPLRLRVLWVPFSTLGRAHDELYAFLAAERRRRLAAGLSCAPERCFTWPYAQMFVAPRWRILYCPVAKCACTALKRLMVEIADPPGRVAILAGDVHSATDRAFTGVQLKDLDPATAEEALFSSDWFRFAVVREPRARLLSAFWEKFVLHRRDPAVQGDILPVLEAVAARRGGVADPERGIAFVDFIHYLAESDPATLNAHWAPQRRCLGDLAYGALFRLDSLDLLAKALSARVGRSIHIPVANVSRSGRGRRLPGAAHRVAAELERLGPVDAASFYEPELDALVRERYADDFALYAAAR
ncbi:MAG: hypothetical protein KatS3mg124_0487 [Porticoccaceae bacterium]|nr:MAG: hypothetical protein KatS3mg124_0487 [Porticoccaceae bacterium]